MFNPSNPNVGRGLLLFAVLALGLALTMFLGQQAWRDAGFWLGIAVFCACYGAITLNALPRLHRLLLIVGLGAGGAAFLLAAQSLLSA